MTKINEMYFDSFLVSFV